MFPESDQAIEENDQVAVRKKVRKSSTLRTINVLGDYWVLWIVREALLGAHSYGEFYSRTGLTHSTLSSRLKRVVRNGLMTRSSPNKSDPGHPEYHLTDKGRDLFRILLAIREWDLKHHVGGSSGLLSGHFVHLACGRPMQPKLVCGHCDYDVHTDDTEARVGPGAGTELAAPVRMQRQIKSGGRNRSISSRGISGAHAIVGDRWATMILAATFSGISRFSVYQSELHVSPHILSRRLDMLVELGILERVAYQQSPQRHEYVLTDQGKDFYPIIVNLMTFGDRWLADDSGPPVIIDHVKCGNRLAPKLICDQCAQELELAEIQFHHEPPDRPQARRTRKEKKA